MLQRIASTLRGRPHEPRGGHPHRGGRRLMLFGQLNAYILRSSRARPAPLRGGAREDLRKFLSQRPALSESGRDSRPGLGDAREQCRSVA
jgi:hypothetical protein